MIDLQERMKRFREQTRLLETTAGEKPPEDARPRRGSQAESMRKHHEKYPGKHAAEMKAWYEAHPGARAEAMRLSEKRHPGRHAESCARYLSKHIHTPKGIGHKYVAAPYKREKPKSCELCKEGGSKLGWHHWVATNSSIGVWLCGFTCHNFAEAADKVPVGVYLGFKEQLDAEYADGEIARRAKLLGIKTRVRTTVNGVENWHLAWGKRDKPANSLCELCGISKCTGYHHWDNSILGKGIWVCIICHKFAEMIDERGGALAEDYLVLKVQEEFRVRTLMKADNAEITPDMFPSLNPREGVLREVKT